MGREKKNKTNEEYQKVFPLIFIARRICRNSRVINYARKNKDAKISWPRKKQV